MDWFTWVKREFTRKCRHNPLFTIIASILALVVIIFLTPLIAELAMVIILILVVGMLVFWIVEKCGFIK
ncbi:MAG TPA: hypothetical protein VN426_07240 [Syntrophomonadaceae bacterium]|nr:hypothetical protein [Syntrophomonadaceae bacterium]